MVRNVNLNVNVDSFLTLSCELVGRLPNIKSCNGSINQWIDRWIDLSMDGLIDGLMYQLIGGPVEDRESYRVCVYKIESEEHFSRH